VARGAPLRPPHRVHLIKQTTGRGAGSLAASSPQQRRERAGLPRLAPNWAAADAPSSGWRARPTAQRAAQASAEAPPSETMATRARPAGHALGSWAGLPGSAARARTKWAPVSTREVAARTCKSAQPSHTSGRCCSSSSAPLAPSGAARESGQRSARKGRCSRCWERDLPLRMARAPGCRPHCPRGASMPKGASFCRPRGSGGLLTNASEALVKCTQGRLLLGGRVSDRTATPSSSMKLHTSFWPRRCTAPISTASRFHPNDRR